MDDEEPSSSAEPTGSLLDPLLPFGRYRDIRVVEDAAESLGVAYTADNARARPSRSLIERLRRAA
jgi:hypothetical protein